MRRERSTSSESDEARRQGSPKYSMMGRAPRQFGVGRTAAVNPGSETTDGLLWIGIGGNKGRPRDDGCK
ncbi:hypothetical protein [uncultured Bacteroides sp.]|uniref:hypothetical protein n=1 Tax=uncultured Bacteroides sp. TaxID=162156 RepID=UPI002610279B|nr:hypothetical protein [uncultured Bacteroides sp.]